jgi:hypothetical protein
VLVVRVLVCVCACVSVQEHVLPPRLAVLEPHCHMPCTSDHTRVPARRHTPTVTPPHSPTSPGEDLLELLDREMRERQAAQAAAEEARQEAAAADKLRDMQVKQISSLSATIADLHSQLQQHLAESGDAVSRGRGGGGWCRRWRCCRAPCLARRPTCLRRRARPHLRARAAASLANQHRCRRPAAAAGHHQRNRRHAHAGA